MDKQSNQEYNQVIIPALTKRKTIVLGNERLTLSLYQSLDGLWLETGNLDVVESTIRGPQWNSVQRSWKIQDDKYKTHWETEDDTAGSMGKEASSPKVLGNERHIERTGGGESPMPAAASLLPIQTPNVLEQKKKRGRPRKTKVN